MNFQELSLLKLFPKPYLAPLLSLGFMACVNSSIVDGGALVKQVPYKVEG